LILGAGQAFLLSRVKELVMTILDPKTGQLVTIDLSSSRPRR